MNKHILYKVLSTGSIRFFIALGSILFTSLIPVFFSLKELGEFTIALSIVLGLSLLARFGFGKYILRVAGENGDKRDPTIRELISVSLVVFFLSLIILVAIGLLQNLTHFAFLQTRSFDVLKYSILPLSLNYVFSRYLNGIGSPEWSPLFEPGAPSAFCALIFVFISFGILEGFDSVLYAWTTLVYVCFFFSLIYLIIKRVSGIKIKTIKETLSNNFNELKNYFLSGLSSYILTMGIYPIMGLSLSESQVGFFRLCERFIGFLNFILVIINSIYAPKFASLWSKGERKGVWQTYVESLKLGWLLCVPAAILIYFFGDDILTNYFDVDFALIESTWVFNILLFATFVNVFFGGVVMLLDMTKHHRIAKNISFTTAGLGILLFFLFSKYFGLLGTAVAYLIVMLLLNILSYFYARSKIIRDNI